MPVDLAGIPQDLRLLDRWLGWNWKWDGRKWTKPPVNCLNGKPGSSTDPKTWCDLATALAAAEAEEVDGIGIALGKLDDGRTLTGVDLDDVRNPDAGEITAEAEAIVGKVKIYWEVSPTATGVKGLCTGEKPKGKCKAGNIELYSAGKYFTITGNALPGCAQRLVEASDSLAWLHSTFIDPPAAPKPDREQGGDRALALQALDALSPARADDYYDWLFVGMALHAVGDDDEMFDAWRAWSEQSDKYVPGVCAEKWESFNGDGNGNGLGVGSLIHWAKLDTGWQPPGTKPPPARPIEIYSLSALQAKFPTLNAPVVDGLVRAGETANLIADPKAGKSWLGYSLLLSICSGRPWLGTFPTERGRVLLVDNELHPPTIGYRIPIVAKAMGLGVTEYRDKFDVLPLRGNLRSLLDLAIEFSNRIERGEYQAILLDAKYRFALEGVSENDNAAETRAYNLLDRISEQSQAAVFIIHHASKGAQGEKKITDVGAGAGAQSRAADCHLVLRAHEDPGLVVLDAVVRSFPPVEALSLQWKFPLFTPDQWADPTKLKGKLAPNEQRQNERDADGMAALKAALAGGPATAKELQRRTGISKDRCDRLLNMLEAKGVVGCQEINRRGNACRQYHLIDPPKGDVVDE